MLRSQPTGHFFNLCMTSSPIHIRYLLGADCGAFFFFDPPREVILSMTTYDIEWHCYGGTDYGWQCNGDVVV